MSSKEKEREVPLMFPKHHSFKREICHVPKMVLKSLQRTGTSFAGISLSCLPFL